MNIKEERKKIIDPIVHKLHLSNKEIEVLSTIDKRNLTSIVNKINKGLGIRDKYVDIMPDNIKCGNLMYRMYKLVCEKYGKKLNPDSKYIITLEGSFVLALAYKAKQLYSLSTKSNESNGGDVHE